MIIWGWTEKLLGSIITNLTCTNCGKSGLVSYTFQRFFTIFFIPTIPLGKRGTLGCPSCGTAFLPENFNQTVTHKTPWWGFSGLILFGSLIALGIGVGIVESQNTSSYIQDPQANDIVVLKVKDDSKDMYPYIKLKSVDGDKITYYQSKYSYSRERDTLKEARNAKVGTELDEEVHEMSKDEFKKLNISVIERP